MLGGLHSCFGMEYYPVHYIVELDCSDAVRMINNDVDERSEQTFMVREIRRLLRERLESKVVGTY